VVRTVLSVLWMLAIAALAGAMTLPRVLDIYIRDRYFTVAKRSLIIFILSVVAAPLLLVTIRQVQTAIGSSRAYPQELGQHYFTANHHNRRG